MTDNQDDFTSQDADRKIETISALRHGRSFFRVQATPPVRETVTAPGVIYASPDLHWLRGPRHVAKANTASYQPLSLRAGRPVADRRAPTRPG